MIKMAIPKVTASQLDLIQTTVERIITSLKSQKVGPCGIGVSGFRMMVAQSCPTLQNLPDCTYVDIMKTLCERLTVSSTAFDSPTSIWILFLEELCISEKAELSVTALPLVEFDEETHNFALKRS
jgi:hypothetical protein